MDNPAEQAVAELVNSWSPDLIVTTGDNYYWLAGGTGAALYDESAGAYYCAYLMDISTAGQRCPAPGGSLTANRFFPSLGNHDYSDTGNLIGLPTIYTDYFSLPGGGYASTSGNERYYDFIAGPIHFFVLNSNPDLTQEPDGFESTSLQAKWLQTQLAASKADWHIVYFHHAPYSSSSMHGSSLWMQWPFAQWGVDAVLSGHDHTYERIFREELVYFVNGLGGAQRYDFGDPIEGSVFRYSQYWGAQKATATSGGLHFEFHSSESGIVLVDRFSLVNSRVITSSGDAEERLSNGAVNLVSTDLELVNDPFWLTESSQLIGLHFANLSIPKDTLITSAYLEFVVDEPSSETTSLVIRAQADDNALAFTSITDNLSSRPLTSSVATWTDIPPWNLPGERQRSPSLAQVVQEIIDRPGWAPGNSLVLLISGTGRRLVESFDKTSGTAPRLYVQYASMPAYDWRVFLPMINR